MIREIIIPRKKRLTVSIPETMIGKYVELIIREQTDVYIPAVVKTIAELKAELRGLTVDMQGYRFDRDEANDYE